MKATRPFFIFSFLIIIPALLSAQNSPFGKYFPPDSFGLRLPQEAMPLPGIPVPGAVKKVTGSVSRSTYGEIIKKEFGLDAITVDIDPAEVARQGKFDNKVPFEDALRLAMGSFMNDDADPESPLALLINDAYDFFYSQGNKNPTRAQLLEKGKEMLFPLLNDPGTELRLYRPGEIPENGEEVSKNWIFSMSLGNYSDHAHWAIVDRSSGRTYNYGFN